MPKLTDKRKKRIRTDSSPCTACGKLIFSINDLARHPLIGALLCKSCYRSHQQVGDLSTYRGGVEINGENNYCRWCLDGGDLLLCADKSCTHRFCLLCIERNLGKKKCTKIKDSPDWYCFICDEEQLTQVMQTTRSFIDLISPKITFPRTRIPQIPQPDIEPRIEPQPQPQRQRQIEAEAESEPQLDIDIDVEPQSQTQSDSDLHQQPHLHPEPEPELQPESEPEPQPESEFEPQPESESELQPESEFELQPESESELQPESEPDPQPESELDPQSEFQPELQPEPQPQLQPEPQPELQPEPQHELQSEPQHELQSESQPELQPDPQPELQPEPQPELQPEPQPELQPEPQPELQPEPELQNVPQVEPQSDSNLQHTQPQSEVQLRHERNLPTITLRNHDRDMSSDGKKNQDVSRGPHKFSIFSYTKLNLIPQPDIEPEPQPEAALQPQAQPEEQLDLDLDLDLNVEVEAQPQSDSNLHQQQHPQPQPEPQSHHEQDLDTITLLNRELYMSSDDESDQPTLNVSSEKENTNNRSIRLTDLPEVENVEPSAEIMELTRESVYINVRILNDRLLILNKSLSSVCNDLNIEDVKKDKNKLYGYLQNVEAFLQSMEPISKRYSHLMELVETAKSDSDFIHATHH